MTNDSNVDSDLIPTGLTVPWTAFEGTAPMGGSKVKGGEGGGGERERHIEVQRDTERHRETERQRDAGTDTEIEG